MFQLSSQIWLQNAASTSKLSSILVINTHLQFPEGIATNSLGQACA